MKTYFALFTAFLMLFSCTDTNKLTLEQVNYTLDSCTNCPNVSINVPAAAEDSKIGASINRALREEIISLLTFEDENEAVDIDGAIASFKNGFLELKNKYPEEAIGWEAKIDGKVVYEDTFMLTLKLDSYLFTGGAHGYSAVRFLNFNKKKGNQLEVWELFENTKDFKRFAERKFRIQEDIPQDDPINSTGFMFEKNEFYLPENIGFTEEGMQLLYNQYEVASYADGPIALTLPYNEIKNYLSRKIKS
ncbi:DUF3298 domain-containing protein [Spongiimicrobium sp. 3-5]|uniref:DUF3298 and DUF4163 domain-containing protein n=1 Tax=Spongiimicrobium sp. 3-5 TaxID=3332596 RepID=UPI0039811809